MSLQSTWPSLFPYPCMGEGCEDLPSSGDVSGLHALQ